MLHQMRRKKLGKFDSRVDEGIFISYLSKIKAFKCCNIRQKQIVESINVTFNENGVLKDNNEIISPRKSEGLEVESMKDEEEALKQDQSNKETTLNQEEIRNYQQDVQETSPKVLIEWGQKNHPSNQIINNIS